MTFPPFHPFRSDKAKARFLALYEERAKFWPVPSETRMVDTSYGQTFVRTSGPADGPPLVLMHGGGGNSLMWIPNVGVMSDHHRVYAVDNIYDFGRSVYTRPVKTPDDFVRWLDDLLGTLEPDRPVSLMGLSYGGWLSCLYALRVPERVNKVVLLAPVCTVLPLPFVWIVRAILTLIPHRYFTKGLLRWMLPDLVREKPAMADRWANDFYVAARCFRLKRLVNPLVFSDEDLAGLKPPVLYLVGENERIYAGTARDAVQRLNRVAPQIETEVIPASGHDLTIVQAAMVNEKVVRFLAGS
jgi:pimeloyl-ACP methyl ester carboxylesterase